jgi:hypothetical protein
VYHVPAGWRSADRLRLLKDQMRGALRWRVLHVPAAEGYMHRCSAAPLSLIVTCIAVDPIGVAASEAVPLVAEANALARSLGKPVQLSIRLVPSQGMFCFPPCNAAGVEQPVWTEEVPEDELRQRFDREVRAAHSSCCSS